MPEYRRHYRGKVKLVYIDPPFNTGQTFTHYDDWMEHSTWLSFMRDRLLLIKELLAPDGSAWVHLDDAEVHRMRCLMDEVFGPANFVACVAWQKVYSPRMDARQFSSSQDYVLVYSRQPEWRPNQIVVEEGTAKTKFPYTDEGGSYNLFPLRKWGANSRTGVRRILDFGGVRGERLAGPVGRPGPSRLCFDRRRGAGDG